MNEEELREIESRMYGDIRDEYTGMDDVAIDRELRYVERRRNELLREVGAWDRQLWAITFVLKDRARDGRKQ